MSFPRYESYKDSGVEWLGEVPEHWKVKRLGYFFSERREKVSDKDYEPLSVTKKGILPQLETAAKTDDGDNRKKVCTGDFVINSRSDRKGSSGMAKQDGSVSLINIVLQPYEEMTINFAHYLFRSLLFQEEFYRYGKGIVADLWSTNFSEMRSILLAPPPIEEQSTIAAFLDFETAQIDALIAEQQKLIALLKEKRQAVISHAVTKGLDTTVPMKDSGIEWLGEVPELWEVTTFRRILKKLEQGWSPQSEDRESQEHEWAVIKLSAVKKGFFYQTEHKVIPEEAIIPEEFEIQSGDLLLTRGNTPELVGDVCFVRETRTRLLMSDLVYRLVVNLKTAFPLYLAYWLLSDAGRCQIVSDARGSSSSMVKISQGHILNWVCFLPPKQEQSTIAAYLDSETTKIDELIAEAQRGIELLKERRSALISAAVTGKIDVRGWTPPEAV